MVDVVGSTLEGNCPGLMLVCFGDGVESLVVRVHGVTRLKYGIMAVNRSWFWFVGPTDAIDSG